MSSGRVTSLVSSPESLGDKRSIILEQMRQSVPEFLLESPLYSQLLKAEAERFGTLNYDIEELLRQFYVDTATYGLDLWERFCGIPASTVKPIDQRRAVIKSKLRGIGTVTAGVIKNVAESYSNGEVSIRELAAEYKLVVTFIGKMGIPPNLADLQASLRALIPAHLDIEYEFTYLTWGNLDQMQLNWNDFDDLQLDWEQAEVLDHRQSIVRSSVGLTMGEP
ncbi:YmfQ family protein [Paenibacillus sp. ACRRX]|uniref:YmfQ family protein n=1 Tax=Paenibacillus sp. ACRRX TaxID=2918206 RepID=UPI001EF602D1|nr:YmfQ family protein [Paenibacillus sp. ACRRX]MCG7410132.1 YmfQ family protein [Paenibacillus sp. ACRRX]